MCPCTERLSRRFVQLHNLVELFRYNSLKLNEKDGLFWWWARGVDGREPVLTRLCSCVICSP